MQTLTRLRSDRYSSPGSWGGSPRHLSGPLLASYHGSPRHSFARRQSHHGVATFVKVVVALLALAACWIGGKYLLSRREGAVSNSGWSSSPPFWGVRAPRTASADVQEAAGSKAWARADRWFAAGTHSTHSNPVGQVEHHSQQQRQEHVQPPPVQPPAPPPVQATAQQQQQRTAAAVSQAPPPALPSTTTPAATDASTGSAAGTAHDPLHESLSGAEKEAEQLAALSHVIQQQQQTIVKQGNALQELQQRFVQQGHALAAATAKAAAANGSEGVQVEPYFAEEKVQQELSMLHRVEGQIEAVAKSIEEASKALPDLTKEQQLAQKAELERADQVMNRLSRVAAAIGLRTSDPLTESGHDPVAELRHYYGTVASDITMDWQEALARQSRPTVDSLGLTMDPFTDDMSDLDTLGLRLEYLAATMQGMNASAPCRLALTTTWSGDLWGLRRELVPWLTYHAYLGVSKLYVLYEGSDQRAFTELAALTPWVTVLLASPPLATAQEVAAFEAWVEAVPDAHIRQWRSQPGNYHLMTKQGYAVTSALQLARADNITWLMHLDPDELLHPGGSHTAGALAGSYSLLPELCSAPAHVPSIRFVNVEGVPEAADITNRYEQVTLFRSHRHLVPPQVQPFRYIFKQGNADAWLHLYTNGKSAVRPDAPGVTQGGPHVFLGPADKRWATPDNPHGIWRPAISNSTLVLHYAYASPGDVAVKAGRSCPPGVVEAVLAGNTSQASQCFVLDLDQRAFLAAIKDRQAAGLAPVAPTPLHSPTAHTSSSSRTSSGPILLDPATFFGSSTSSGFSNSSWPVGRHVLDFFFGELVLSEGAPFECLTPDGKATGWCAMRDVDKLKSLLISSGLMLRLHAPAQTMKGIETAIQQLMLLGHRKASSEGIAEVVVASPAQAAEMALAAAAAAAAAADPTQAAQAAQTAGKAQQAVQQQGSNAGNQQAPQQGSVPSDKPVAAATAAAAGAAAGLDQGSRAGNGMGARGEHSLRAWFDRGGRDSRHEVGARVQSQHVQQQNQQPHGSWRDTLHGFDDANAARGKQRALQQDVGSGQHGAQQQGQHQQQQQQQQGQQPQGPPEKNTGQQQDSSDSIERGALAWPDSPQHPQQQQRKGWRKVEVPHEHVRDRLLLS